MSSYTELRTGNDVAKEPGVSLNYVLTQEEERRAIILSITDDVLERGRQGPIHHCRERTSDISLLSVIVW